MIQIFSTIIAASLVALAVSSPVSTLIEVKSGFEFLGAVEGKVLLRPVDAPHNLSYQDAIAKCNSAGYRIATIESEAQHQIIKPYSCQDSSWYWIDGVSFQAPSETFFSINTGSNLTYFHWGSGRPFPSPENICLATACGYGGFVMWDVRCVDRYSVICEVSV